MEPNGITALLARDKAAYSVKEVAPALAINAKTIYAAMKAGDIPSLKIASRLLIPAWWLKRQQDGAAS